jgi:hypothetical protein
VGLVGDLARKLAGRDRRRRILSMDEAKTLLEYPEGARLVAHSYTLGRAHNLGVWRSATQLLLADDTSTPDGERALQSAGVSDTALRPRGGWPSAVGVGGAPSSRHPMGTRA